MSDQNKRIILIILLLFITIGMGFGIYWMFFRAKSPASKQISATQDSARLSPSGEATPNLNTGEVTFEDTQTLEPANANELILPTDTVPDAPRTQLLVSAAVRSLAPAARNDGARYYNSLDGKFYRITVDGNQIALSDREFPDVFSVTWGKQTDKAVLTFPDGSNIIYDFNANQQTTLPKHWENFDFSPGDTHIVSKAIGSNNGNRFLVVANADGSNVKAIEDLGDNQDKVQASWSPNNQVIAFSATGEPIGFDRQTIAPVGQNRENFRHLIVEGRGFLPNWSPSGNNLLYSAYNASDGYRPALWITKGSGDNVNATRRSVGLFTWADKCAWANERLIYCAVPGSLSEGAGLQRNLFTNSKDFIYRIDLDNGSLTNLGQPDGLNSIKTIVINQDGHSLMLNDGSTGQLASFLVD